MENVRLSPNRPGTFTGGPGDFCLAYWGAWGGYFTAVGAQTEKNTPKYFALILTRNINILGYFFWFEPPRR